jgi:EmrB/QacA subfamily drug resistance transporter
MSRQTFLSYDEADAQPPQLSGIGIAILLAGAVLPFLDMFIVNVALPAINSSFTASTAALELTIAGYGTAYALLLIVGGRLGDAYGRRSVFIWGLAGFTLSSLACGVAPNIDVLVGARIAQGVSAAMIMPQVLGTFQAALSGARQGKAIGFYGAAAGMSAVAGQLVGGLLIAANIAGASWRPIFLVNVPIGLVAILVAWRLVPETKSEKPASVDLPGMALFGITMLCLLIPLTEGQSLGWPAWTFVVLAIAPVAAAATYFVERRSERGGGSPLLPPSLFALRSVHRGSALAVPFFLGFGAFMFVFSLTVQEGLHQSPLNSGLAITPLAVAFFIGSTITPRLLARFGRTVLLVGGLLNAVSLASLAGIVLEQWPEVQLVDLAPSLAVSGFAGALIFVSVFRLILSDVPVHLAGIGGGVMVTLQQSSYALGVAALGTLFLSLQRTNVSAGFGWVVGIDAAAGLVVAVGSFILPSRAAPGENMALENIALEV